MAKRMLIDATHLEEKRVAILNNNKLEEFDYETSTKKQNKGNIYLAKVIRIEPSLQAAFVEYGGNRHGFLAFGEIHPDYYRIPVEDRQALVESEDTNSSESADSKKEDIASLESPENETNGEGNEEAGSEEKANTSGVETVGGLDNEEVASSRRTARPFSRGYKIQDVVKRHQIMLVQVVKEERSAKGAALTTYLSLAGRYCVVMPNAERGGGVSRKITNSVDRKRLKSVMEEGLEIPENMGVIIRTAGMERSKAEIKRDFEYLIRLWDEIREATLRSTAPSLIHQEGDLIKRAIRDLYTRDVEEIYVEGEEGFKEAKNFMRTLMPSHARRVHLYQNEVLPIFHHYDVEDLIDSIHSPTVQLKSGGYIVINPTEALVSIDVNSGKATRERHIEETAFKTILEAAEEIALQLRLRDLAGLIVIDFIDMEESRHANAVERRLKEAMAHDRARIQIGRISPFGLLELSRQRLRSSIIEASTLTCPHCSGSGHIRSTESSALHVLRAIEEEGIKAPNVTYTLKVPEAIALYLLNQKRQSLIILEKKYSLCVDVGIDKELIAPQFLLEYPGKKEQKKDTLKKDPRGRTTASNRSKHEKDRGSNPRHPSPSQTTPETEGPKTTDVSSPLPKDAEPSSSKVSNPQQKRSEHHRHHRRVPTANREEQTEMKAIEPSNKSTEEPVAHTGQQPNEGKDRPQHRRQNQRRKRGLFRRFDKRPNQSNRMEGVTSPFSEPTQPMKVSTVLPEPSITTSITSADVSAPSNTDVKKPNRNAVRKPRKQTQEHTPEVRQDTVAKPSEPAAEAHTEDKPKKTPKRIVKSKSEPKESEKKSETRSPPKPLNAGGKPSSAKKEGRPLKSTPDTGASHEGSSPRKGWWKRLLD